MNNNCKCEDCIHKEVCYDREVCNDIEEQIKEFGCENFIYKNNYTPKPNTSANYTDDNTNGYMFTNSAHLIIESMFNILTNKDNINIFTEEQINFLRELIESCHNCINNNNVLNDKREAWWLNFYEKYLEDLRQFICTNCKNIQKESTSYCPNCECKMSQESLEE